MYRIVFFAILLVTTSGQLLPCQDEFDALDECHDAYAECSECTILQFSNPFTAGFCAAINEGLCGAYGCCEPCANVFTSYKTCLETSNLVVCEVDCDPVEGSSEVEIGIIEEEEETVTDDLETSGCFNKFTDFATCAIQNPLQCGSCFLNNIPIPDDFAADGFCNTAEESICGFGNCCSPCSQEFEIFDACFEEVVDDITFGLCDFDCEANGGGGGGNVVEDCTDSFGAYSNCLRENPLQCALCLLTNLPDPDDTVCENTRNTVCGVGDCCDACVDQFDQFEICLETVSSLVTIGSCTIDCDEVPDPPTVPPSSGFGGFSCFSPKNDVLVDGKGYISMNDLKIGDMVQTGEGEFGRVYSFGHYSPNAKSEYLQLHVENQNKPLEISKDHMVFVEARGPVPAFAVSTGDRLVVSNKSVATVEKIANVNRVGAFAPFTESGTIVVNGVLASSYVSLQEEKSGSLVIGNTKTVSMHWLAHVLQAPHRLICHVSASICENETYTTDGISHWVHSPLLFSKWLLRQPTPLLTLVSIPLVLLGMAMQFVEYFFLKVQFGGIFLMLVLSFVAHTKSTRAEKTKKLL